METQSAPCTRLCADRCTCVCLPLQVFAKALDKCEHEGEGYSFMPTINPLSRQLALANYAVAPDPSRPWTKPDAASTK